MALWGGKEEKRDRGEVKRGRIAKMPSREAVAWSRLKFCRKADKIISRQKSPLCLAPVWERKRKAAIQI